MQILIYLTNNACINSLTVEIHLVLKVGTRQPNLVLCAEHLPSGSGAAWFDMV